MSLIELAREMGKEIQASEEYKKLHAAKEAADADTELQDLIGKFNMKRFELNSAMSEENKDDAKIAKLNEELKEAYNAAMSNTNMQVITAAQNEMDSMMQQVTNILMMCVNGEDPETCDPNPHSCGGSCATCSGCH